MSLVSLGLLERVNEHADLQDHPSIVIIPQTAATLRLTDAQARGTEEGRDCHRGGSACVCVCVCREEPVTNMHVMYTRLCDVSVHVTVTVCVDGFILCILSLSGRQLTVINISQRTNGEHRQASVCA